ncbi:DMT family transporter [Thioalkalivibrio sp.]|uniref:DMT family transporter n=1 Tax=Thioalkalivibrio sp. TaxID=2093813 RepID=UPI0035640D2D
MTRQGLAYAYAGAAVLLWSTVASAFKLSLQYLDPLQLLLFSNAVSVLVLFTVLAVQGRIDRLREQTATAWWRLAGLGVLNPFLYYIVLFQAYDLLPAQQAQALNYTWAITLAILSIPLLGQRIGTRGFIALLVSYAGVVVIATEGRPLDMAFTSLPGVLLALGSTIIWALYWIYNTRHRGDPVAALLIGFAFSLPLVLITTLLFSELTWPSWQGWLGAAWVGTFEMGLAFVFWLHALRLSATTARVGNLIFLAPFLSLVFIHFLVGETVLPATLLGLVLIIAGNVVQQWRPPRRAHDG